MCILISVEMDNTAKAQVMLDKLKPHKNVLKGNPLHFAAYTALLCYFDLKKGKTRSAKKHFAALEAYNDSEDLPEIDVFLGGLALEQGLYQEGLEYLLYAYEQESRSCFLFLFLYDFFARSSESYIDALSALKPFLAWGTATGADLSGIIMKWKREILSAAERDADFAKQLYSVYPLDFILISICETGIKNKDYSDEAFRYYKEAEFKQLSTAGLSTALILSAFKNGHENLSRYSMERFLADNPDDFSVKPFVYHIMLRDSAYSDTVKKYREDIIRLGLHCLENNVEFGLYLGNVYRFLLDELDFSSAEKDKRHKKLLDKAEQTVKDAMFAYDVRVENSKAKYVRVFEKEKGSSASYALNGGRARITASSDSFSCYAFDSGMKNIVNSEIAVTRPVDADVKLYSKFYAAGYQSANLLIALSANYISQSLLDEKGAEVLEKTACCPEISQLFAARLSAALGNYFSAKNNSKKAVEYYSVTDENLLDAKSIENKLLALANAGEFAAAATLISKKSNFISDKSLFYSVKKIAAETKDFDPLIADAAVRLTLSSWHDKTVAAVVLKYDHSGQDGMQGLSRALHASGAPDAALDEKILFSAVKTRIFEAGAQKVFARMYEKNPESPGVSAFSVYAAYEIIINNRKPEYETLEALEKIVLNGERSYDERFVTYALCHTYVNYGVTTFHSDEIISRAMRYSEEDGFIFPVLKEVKDKKLIIPYIDKNHPFVHKCGKGKDVYLYYKIEGAKGGYTKKQMRYVRFGLYAACVPVFFGEKLAYYFSEEIKSGSIVTKEEAAGNNQIHFVENPSDMYYIINNAVIYESMFKYDAVEKIITDKLEELPRINGWLM